MPFSVDAPVTSAMESGRVFSLPSEAHPNGLATYV